MVTESERQYPSVGDGDEDCCQTADDVRFVLVLEGQFTCKPELRSQKVELCCEVQLSKCRARNLADRESGRVELDRSDVLRRESW